MWIIVGLGNPGPSYSGHRHNVGFMAVERLADAAHARAWTQKFSAKMTQGELGGEKLIFLEPQTFMNLSGQAVGEAARFYKVPPENIIVLHDELDVELGRLRIKQGGGHGGHNGLKSIDAHIGKEYHRLRIGISHPGDKDRVSGYVLSNFAKAEEPVVEDVLHAIVRHFPKLLKQDSAGFLNDCALDLQKK